MELVSDLKSVLSNAHIQLIILLEGVTHLLYCFCCYFSLIIWEPPVKKAFGVPNIVPFIQVPPGI